MSEVYVQNKQIVIPGELLGTGMDLLPSGSTFREDENIYSSKVGIVTLEGRLVKVIPLAGRYVPKKGDTIVGIVNNILMSGWRVDLDGPYEAVLSVRDATEQYIAKGDDLKRIINIGDVIFAKVSNVTTQMLIDLTLKGPGYKKLYGGRIIRVTSSKVPRIIGKKGSMIKIIKDATSCKIVVGQNGRVWLSGEPEMEILAIRTINKIEEEAHTSGLTERIKEFLEAETKTKITLNEETENQR